jgi:2-phosphosulfolactate phosphatase
MPTNRIEVCLSPALFNELNPEESITVVVDILRATSAICNAFENGARSLIPVGTVEEAKQYKKRGFLLAAERDGIVLDFADFGNSPFNFSSEIVGGKDIAYSTTNGTRTIEIASDSFMVAIGSFINISTLAEWLAHSGRDVIILCAGWKNKVNLEDSFYAGALAEKLLETGNFITQCDSVEIALDLWSAGKDDILGYIEKAAQRSRLREKGLDDCIPFCHKPDIGTVIPVLKDGSLIPLVAKE